MREWEVISCESGPIPDSIKEPLYRAYSMLVSPPLTFPAVEPVAKVRIQDTESCITIPVIGAGQTIGVLNVTSSWEHAFSADDVGAISTAALMIGSFVQNVRAYEEEAAARAKIEGLASRLTEHVHLLQQALLPRKPVSVPGYRIATTFIPGGEGVEIGGDFFDVFDTRDGRIGLLIGDVTGKGIPSASLAVSTRSTVRAYAYESSRASRSLGLANSMLFSPDPLSGLFVTVFLAILDPATGYMEYASGGHPTPVVWRGDTHETEPMGGGELPVGIMPTVEYNEGCAFINPGDKIVFYTDGISEARHDGVLFGTDGVERALRDHGHLPPDELLHALLSESSRWSRDHAPDDIAVIILERTAE